MNPCHSTMFCNTCEVINVSGDILNADKDEYEFTGSIFKKAQFIIDKKTKM